MPINQAFQTAFAGLVRLCVRVLREGDLTGPSPASTTSPEVLDRVNRANLEGEVLKAMPSGASVDGVVDSILPYVAIYADRIVTMAQEIAAKNDTGQVMLRKSDVRGSIERLAMEVWSQPGHQREVLAILLDQQDQDPHGEEPSTLPAEPTQSRQGGEEAPTRPTPQDQGRQEEEPPARPTPQGQGRQEEEEAPTRPTPQDQGHQGEGILYGESPGRRTRSVVCAAAMLKMRPPT
jgi:hypothetical protein